MLFEKFSKDVFYSLTPNKFHKLMDYSVGNGIKYFTKILVIAYIIMAILFIPKIVNLADHIGSEIDKFQTFSIGGTVIQTEPIKIPEKEPLLIIDATGNEVSQGKERILITRDSLYYKLFYGQKEIPLDQIKELSQNPAVATKLTAYILFFILPSIIFFSFGSIWLKYLMAIFVLGTITFLLLDLTRFNRSWKTCVKSACYASTIIIPVEIIFSSLNNKWMLSLFSFWGLHIYLVPLVAWLVLSLIFVACLYLFKPKYQSKH